MTRCLVLVLVLAGACKKDDSTAQLQATATVTGSAVAITATCTNFSTVHATEQGAYAECSGGKAVLEVPVSKLGTGKQTIHVIGSNDNGRTMATADVVVDVSLAGQAPYLRLTGCNRNPADDRPTAMRVQIGDRTTDCETFDGVNAKLIIEANPKSKLTIAGQAI